MYFEGKDKDNIKFQDVMNEMEKCTTEEEAQNFLSYYLTINEKAKEHIGYLTGYFDNDRANELLKLFNVEHPVFGKTMPTPEKAFKMGFDYGNRKSK